jgi:mannose-6-phosphate isomerase-like protein (cupin superfamily)
MPAVGRGGGRFSLGRSGQLGGHVPDGRQDDCACVVKGDVLALDCATACFFPRGQAGRRGPGKWPWSRPGTPPWSVPWSQVQRVKDVVNRLKAEKSSLVEAHVTVRRPWGSYTVLEEGQFYKIKRIMVHPGARLSLQMHHHRSEHWVVIKGTAMVQVGDQETIVVENQSVDIPKASMHRLSNPAGSRGDHRDPERPLSGRGRHRPLRRRLRAQFPPGPRSRRPTLPGTQSRG